MTGLGKVKKNCLSYIIKYTKGRGISPCFKHKWYSFSLSPNFISLYVTYVCVLSVTVKLEPWSLYVYAHTWVSHNLIKEVFSLRKTSDKDSSLCYFLIPGIWWWGERGLVIGPTWVSVCLGPAGLLQLLLELPSSRRKSLSSMSSPEELLFWAERLKSPLFS